MKKIVYCAISIAIILVLFSAPLSLADQMNLFESSVRIYPAEKDPFVAGLLSWLMMGTGQIYCHEYTKGSLFVAADLVDKVALVLLISHINSTYAPSSGEIININWDAFSTETKTLTILYFLGSVSLHFYSVIDAVNSANEYNRKYFSRGTPRGTPQGVSFSFSGDEFGVSYNIRFNE
jgi:hypothetical protein